MTEPGPSAGDRVLAEAAERAERTRPLNLPQFEGLPVPADTANLRQGPDLDPALLSLLPLVGIWRGTGEADHPNIQPYRFGQQVVAAHDGRGFLTWESRTWLLDGAGAVVGPGSRESGFWRVTPAADGEDTVELLLTTSTGTLELFYGGAISKSAWELSTDVVLRTQTAAEVTGAHRLYGIVEGGDLGYVEERAMAGLPLQPYLSARLERVAG